MGRLTEDRLDQLIKEALEEELNAIEVPPSEHVWDRIQRTLYEEYDYGESKGSRLRGKGPQKRIWAFRIAGVTASIALLLGVFSLAFPGQVSAIRGRIMESVRIALKGPLSMIVTGYKLEDRNKNKPPVIENLVEVPQTEEELLSLNEASSKVPFRVLAPGYLPTGFKLEKIKLIKFTPDNSLLILTYTGPSGKYLELREEKLTGDMGLGSAYDSDDTEVSEVKIKENVTALVKHMKKKLVHVIWFEENMHFDLFGELPLEEAIKVAKSLKEI